MVQLVLLPASVRVIGYAGIGLWVVIAVVILWLWSAVELVTSSSLRREVARPAYWLSTLALPYLAAKEFYDHESPRIARHSRFLAVCTVLALLSLPFLLVAVSLLISALFSIFGGFWWIVGLVPVIVLLLFLVVTLVGHLLIMFGDMRLRRQVMHDHANELAADVVDKLVKVESQAGQIALIRWLRSEGFFNDAAAVTALRDAARSKRLTGGRVVDEVGMIVADHLRSA
jgi:hypothetical protein